MTRDFIEMLLHAMGILFVFIIAVFFAICFIQSAFYIENIAKDVRKIVEIQEQKVKQNDISI